MNETIFKQKLKKKNYQSLEKELILSYKQTKDPHDKYLLGICYSMQLEKLEEASSIFRNLISTSWRTPNMYLFLSNQTFNPLERFKIIQEGLKYFPNDRNLNNQLLFELEDKEKILLYEKLKKEKNLTFFGEIHIVSYYYKQKEYKISYTLLKELFLFKESHLYKKELDFLKILLSYLSGHSLSQENLNESIILQTNTIEGFLVRLIEIILEKDLQKQIFLIKELPYSTNFSLPFLEIFHYPHVSSSVFSLKEPLKNILILLKSNIQNQEAIQKLEFLYDMMLFYWKENLTTKKVQSLLKKTLNLSENIWNENLSSLLLDLSFYLKDYQMYFSVMIKELNLNHLNESFFNPYAFQIEELSLLLKEIQNHSQITWNLKSYQIIIQRLVYRLFQENQFSSIVELMDHIPYQKLNYLDFGFEIAYSFQNQNRKKEAKNIYEAFIQSKKESASSANNLGILYEEEQNYTKAIFYFQKALDVQFHSIYKKNLDRCQNLLRKQTLQKQKEKQALILIKQESLDFVSKLRLLYAQENSEHYIFCKSEYLSVLFQISDIEAQLFIAKAIENGYLFQKEKTHSNHTYRKNSLVEKKLKQQSFELFRDYIHQIRSITLFDLEQLEYSKTVKYLHKIKDKKMKNIFIRDYHELVFSYLSNQSKSVILLSGSIIELLLLYLLKIHGIMHYYLESKQKKKSISEMDISELLEVCMKENLLHKTSQNFVNGMKQFRNFIHPGKEIREKTLEIDKSSIELAFNMVNWLIQTIQIFE